MDQTWKIGELARASGLTVRTLHHYDQLGLLRPSRRSDGGHRHYTGDDVRRLYRIVALRDVGLPLEHIGRLLDDPHRDASSTLWEHLVRLEHEIAARRQLADRLRYLLTSVHTDGELRPADFLETIEGVVKMEETIRGYYSPEQLARLEQRRAALGEDAIRAVEAEWPRLMDKVAAELRAGTDPADPTMQALARRWRELSAMFHGGDADIQASADQLWQEQGDTLQQQFFSDKDWSPGELWPYVQRSLSTLDDH